MNIDMLLVSIASTLKRRVIGRLPLRVFDPPARHPPVALQELTRCKNHLDSVCYYLPFVFVCVELTVSLEESSGS